MRTSFLLPILVTASLTAAAAAQVSNMSGTWVLNEKRSRFADDVHPGQVTLNIEHQEPKLKYDGRTNNPEEGQYNDFRFNGAIDDKEYVVKQDNGDRKITFHRLSERVVESVSHGPEGEFRSRMTMSRDGNTLERRITLVGRDGKTRRWVEVYEKKK